MVVLKFGGSSVGKPERFQNAVTIVREYALQQQEVVIIASALRGVTDRLVEAGEVATPSASVQREHIEWLYQRHSEHAQAVLGPASIARFEPILNGYLDRVRELMEALSGYNNEKGQERAASAARDELLAVGERLSVHLFALAMEEQGILGSPVDAASLIHTDDTFGNAQVHIDATYANIQAWYQARDVNRIPVITGFIGRSPDGLTTTLGRGGSDYSASILAAGLRAHLLERWTDVDGIYTSDPGQDSSARRLDYIVMEDALSWNKAGKMGLHRKTLDPLIDQRISLRVRSIDTPELQGTLVQPRPYRRVVAC